MVLGVILTHAKKHPALIPLFVIIGSGGVGAGLYLMRLAMFNPDVSWDKKNNPEPWNKMSPSDQYKTLCFVPFGKLVFAFTIQEP